MKPLSYIGSLIIAASNKNKAKEVKKSTSKYRCIEKDREVWI
jgi:hypothetical protein